MGNAFDIQKLWSDGDTFATFGNILCGKPFPKSDNIRLVERAFEHDDYNGPDREELDVMPSKTIAIHLLEIKLIVRVLLQRNTASNCIWT